MGHDAEAADITDHSGAALKRMKRAHERGTGCRLTREQIEALSVTLIGEWWGHVNDDGSSSL